MKVTLFDKILYPVILRKGAKYQGLEYVRDLGTAGVYRAPDVYTLLSFYRMNSQGVLLFGNYVYPNKWNLQILRIINTKPSSLRNAVALGLLNYARL
jgi:hypothetical protein